MDTKVLEKLLSGLADRNIRAEDIIEAVKRMRKRERAAFLEGLLAATSPEYLDSIKEARADYRAGRVKNHHEVFTS